MQELFIYHLYIRGNAETLCAFVVKTPYPLRDAAFSCFEYNTSEAAQRPFAHAWQVKKSFAPSYA